MEIITWTLGPMANNVYLLVNDYEKSIVVDPAWNDEFIVQEAEEKHKPIGLILLTHGHFDHCLSVAYIKEKTGAEIWIHGEDDEYLKRISEKARSEFGIDIPMKDIQAEKKLTDGEIIKWGDDEIKVIHTPGHTPGGVCFLTDKILITGDTLFAGSVGRWDLTGGDGKQLFKSIKERILPLGDDIKIYPGHGPESTIGKEKNHNQLLKMSEAELGLF